MVSLMDFLAAECKEIHTYFHICTYVYVHRITIKRWKWNAGLINKWRTAENVGSVCVCVSVLLICMKYYKTCMLVFEYMCLLWLFLTLWSLITRVFVFMSAEARALCCKLLMRFWSVALRDLKGFCHIKYALDCSGCCCCCCCSCWFFKSSYFCTLPNIT